jgi:hypothetical protein
VAGQAAGLIALALLAFAGAASAGDPDKANVPPVPWNSLSPEERRVLEPVAPDWPRLPGYQQQRLKGAAKKYPEMQPIQKERFESRLRDWASMTPDQRKAARETYQGLRKLPPEKQHELRERWLQQREREHRSAPPSSGPPPR